MSSGCCRSALIFFSTKNALAVDTDLLNFQFSNPDFAHLIEESHQ